MRKNPQPHNMNATTPWERGRLGAFRGKPRLLFGQMYEDWDIEAEVLPPGGRVFTIASAGSTSMALAARGLAVTAVDINPAQVDYVRARLQGAAPRTGTADRFFAAGRRFLPLMGLPRSRIREFLELTDPAAQLRFWREHLDKARFRAALALVINRLALRAIYSATFVKILPRHFDRIIRARLERCWARHPNRTNPYAWRFFLGTDPPDWTPTLPSPNVSNARRALKRRSRGPTGPASGGGKDVPLPISGGGKEVPLPVSGGGTPAIELVCADAAAYLENCPPASFIGFSLSNILDGTEPAYGERLMAAVRRSAQDGAVVVLRSFMEPPPGESTEWAARDRSMIWGRLTVERVH
jgi:S-adenosylmethionine:diacylglycerol 3-amino-3-carboxypropyl transferase